LHSNIFSLLFFLPLGWIPRINTAEHLAWTPPFLPGSPFFKSNFFFPLRWRADQRFWVLTPLPWTVRLVPTRFECGRLFLLPISFFPPFPFLCPVGRINIPFVGGTGSWLVPDLRVTLRTQGRSMTALAFFYSPILFLFFVDESLAYAQRHGGPFQSWSV